MTFPVQIEYGTKDITAHLHALPRPGDRIHCAFPSAGISRVFLVVKYVSFRQLGDFVGKVCREPFGIVVWAVDDPDHLEHNKAAFPKLDGRPAKRVGRKRALQRQAR
jgi:hypothetical protein